jgi:hypothetical protein
MPLRRHGFRAVAAGSGTGRDARAGTCFRRPVFAGRGFVFGRVVFPSFTGVAARVAVFGAAPLPERESSPVAITTAAAIAAAITAAAIATRICLDRRTSASR